MRTEHRQGYWIPGVSRFHLLYVAILCCLQFLPLIFDSSYTNNSVETALSDFDVQMTASFCLGFLSIILFDLLTDLANKNLYRFVSRSLYYWTAVAYSVIVIGFHSAEGIVPVYYCYLACSTVFICGRALQDLSALDSTGTWTTSRSMFITGALALGQLLSSFSLGDSSDSGDLLYALGRSWILIAGGCMLINLALFCSVRVRWHEDFRWRASFDPFNLVYGFTLGFPLICLLLIAILPLAIDSFSSRFQYESSLTVCTDMVVRLALASILEILPSFLLKTRDAAKVGVLQEDLNLKSTFVRYIGHEVRTPLNIAVVGLDLIKRIKIEDDKRRGKGKGSDEILTLLEEVEDSCKVAVTQLDDLLAYEKLGSGLMKLEKSIVNVVGFVLTSASLFGIQARGKNIRMDVLQTPGVLSKSVHFNIDFGKLTQVMRNLISNALKFTPEGDDSSN